MEKTAKKLLSLALAIIMMFSVFSVTSFADGDDIAKLEICNVYLEAAEEGSTYYYSPDFYVYLNNGKTVWGNYGWVYTPNGMFDLTVTDTQEEKPFEAGKSYTATGTLGGLTAEFTVYLTEKPSDSNFGYTESEEGVIITSFNNSTKKVIEIPETVNGKKVIGVLNPDYRYIEAETIKFSNSVKFTSDSVINNCKELYLGASFNGINQSMIEYNFNLEAIHISEDNPYYSEIDGIVYNKDKTELVCVPVGYKKEIVLPKTVSDISLFENYPAVSAKLFKFESGNENFADENGVIFNKEKTQLVRCSTEKSGAYTVPDNVTDVVYGAFANCDKLTNVTLPNGVTSVVYTEFYGCTSLNNVSMPASVTSIDDYAFYNCSSLNGVELPENLSNINEMAFSLSGLNKVTLPKGISYLSDRVFENCENLETVNLNEGLRTIDYQAFLNCSSLKSIKLPDSVLSLGSFAFAECKALNDVNFGNGLEDISYNAFYNSGITSAVLPDSVSYMGESVFENCEKLTDVKLGSGISYISEKAFYNCGISEITIPETVSYIREGAFANCKNLTEVTFNNDSVEIYGSAFYNCPLENLTLPGQITEIKPWSFSGGKITKLNVPESVTEIMYCAFANCNLLSDITLPDTVEHIGTNAFKNTENVNKQSNGAVYVGKNVLYGLKGTAPALIKVNGGVTVMADCAFANGYMGNTSGLTEVQLPAGLKNISDFAFYNCSALKNVVIPNTVEKIGDGAFYGCKSLESLHIPENVSEIYYTAFFGCTSLKNVTVDENNKYFCIEDGVLYNKDKSELIFCFKRESTTLTLPDTVHYIGECAFGTTNVKLIYAPNDEMYTNMYPFHSATLTQLDFDGLRDYRYEKSPIKITIACSENSYLRDSCGVYPSITFKPLDYKPQITRLEVIKQPNKTEYEIGETFDETGISVNAVYDNGYIAENISGYTFTDTLLTDAGRRKVTLNYNGVTAGVFVDVKAKPDTAKIVMENRSVKADSIIEIPVTVQSDSEIKNFKYTATLPEGFTLISQDNDVITLSVDKDLSIGTYYIGLTVTEFKDGTGKETEYTVMQSMVNITRFSAGDVTGDNEIDATDLVRLKKHLAQQLVDYSDGSDCTADGDVNASDLIRLKKKLAMQNVKLG